MAGFLQYCCFAFEKFSTFAKDLVLEVKASCMVLSDVKDERKLLGKNNSDISKTFIKFASDFQKFPDTIIVSPTQKCKAARPLQLEVGKVNCAKKPADSMLYLITFTETVLKPVTGT